MATIRFDIKWSMYSKTCLKQPLKKKTKLGFQDRLSLNVVKCIAECTTAILSTFIKLPFVIKIFEDRLSLNAVQKYCRMLQEEHSAILSTFIKLSICH